MRNPQWALSWVGSPTQKQAWPSQVAHVGVCSLTNFSISRGMTERLVIILNAVPRTSFGIEGSLLWRGERESVA